MTGIPHYFTDAQLEVLERNAEYQRANGKCPVCLGHKVYRYLGEEHECPDDDYGHPMLRLAKLYWLHNVELEYMTLLWDEYPHEHVVESVAQYLANFERLRMVGAGFTVYSPALGVGKTWAAVHVLKEIVKRGHTGWMVKFFDLKNLFEMENKKERDWLRGKILDSEVLVLDDILKPWASGAQRSFFEEKLEEVVRTRANRNFPTLVTTNMTMEEFEREYPRVYSLLSAKNDEYEVGGVDKRKDGAIWYDHYQLAMKGETRPIT